MNRTEKVLVAVAAGAVGAWWLARRRPWEPRYNFSGNVVLITGGSRGLGLVLARQLVDEGAKVAICARDEVVLSWPAKMASRFKELFPEVTASLLRITNDLLPEPGGVGKQARRGAESESSLSPSILTHLTDRAAQRNNEVAPTEA